MTEYSGTTIYITHCPHGLDLRIYPRCYMCQPLGSVPGDYPGSFQTGGNYPTPHAPICGTCGLPFTPTQPYHIHYGGTL